MAEYKRRKNSAVWFPEAIDDCLRLQANLQCTHKATLIRSIVTKHANDNEWSVENLTERYAKHLYTQWDLRWKEKIDFRSYMAQSAGDLIEKHRLPNRLSKRIIELCEEQHKMHQLLSK